MVAIVGILIVISIPRFLAQAQQTRRADAAVVLTNAVTVLERYAIANGYNYEGAVVGTTIPAKSPIDGNTEYYSITLTNLTQTTYRINAVPMNDQITDPCGTIAIDQSGSRYAGAAIDDCWR